MAIQDQRQRWKAYWQKLDELSAAWQAGGCIDPVLDYPSLPDDLLGMTCGAVTRAGTPCKQKAIYSNGRCKFHGGMATGPTSDAGKEQSRINGRKGGRPSKAGARLLSDVAISDATMKTEVMEPQGIPKVGANGKVSVRVSQRSLGKVQGRVKEIQAPVRQDYTPEKPKSSTLKEAKFLPMCERCTMFAGTGACLAIAKGLISSMPTGEDCPAFSAF